MERFVGYSERRVRKDLPPREVWHHDPKQLIDTPLDERGLVDLSALISVIKSTVDSDYEWPSPFNDRHHVYWPRRFYPRNDGAGLDLYEFDNLGINKVKLPRHFHNWLHLITLPPPMPSLEVMQYRIEAQRVAVSLFKGVVDLKRQAKELSLHGDVFDGYIEEMLENEFEYFQELIDIGRSQPKEFQPINYDSVELRETRDIINLSKLIGRKAIYLSAVRQVRVA